MLAVQRLVRGLAAVTCTFALAGCLNVSPETGKPYPYAPGANVDAGDMAVRNVLVMVEGESAEVVAAVTNRGEEDDRLVSVTVGDSEASLVGERAIPARGGLVIGPEGDVKATAPATGVEPGRSVEVTLVFGNGPRASVTTIVKPAATSTGTAGTEGTEGTE